MDTTVHHGPGADAHALSGTTGNASGMRALCVSIHDVAPATWDDCARLADAMRDVAGVALTWLVVPHYHRAGGGLARMEAGLERALAAGDELALHGWTHFDTGPRARGMVQGFLRGRYSHEGEFAALDAAEASRRIELGLAWFAARAWPVRGFVPPAWLMGEGSWQALRTFDFDYTTSFRRFYLLAHAAQDEAASAQAPPLLAASLRPASLLSPALVYAARNRSGRLASPLLADVLALALAGQPLVRLGLHPPDAHHRRLLRHAQAMLERLLVARTALTKAGFAQALLTSTGPSNRHHASDAIRFHHRTMDCCRSGAALRGY
ncbi:polysaccharide deacetylase family protein [Massilia sp. H6]|uniref:polysaccharide deacetylase family protein n=1 Tax=Massilia sp. H6 TaxID=2970464 RepID=UPI002169802D|nr:polysaccharide deacetylase family protein [Massilia sp. H6]UVW30105.1 polysaccharide deacetylase family protein [Massilia sp. H6]